MILFLCYILSLSSEMKFQVSVVRRHFIQFDVKTDITSIFLTPHVSQPPKSYSCRLHHLFILFYSQVSHSTFPKLSTLSLQCNLCAWCMQVNVHTYVYDQSEGIMR